MSANRSDIKRTTSENGEYSRDYNMYDSFTNSAIEDELTYRLSSICDFQIDAKAQTIYLNHKYLDYAEKFLYRMNAFRPIPKFQISHSDIPKKLETTLCSFDKKTLNSILTNVVRRILESANPLYFHTNGIHGRVQWRIVE